MKSATRASPPFFFTLLIVLSDPLRLLFLGTALFSPFVPHDLRPGLSLLPGSFPFVPERWNVKSPSQFLGSHAHSSYRFTPSKNGSFSVFERRSFLSLHRSSLSLQRGFLGFRSLEPHRKCSEYSAIFSIVLALFHTCAVRA